MSTGYTRSVFDLIKRGLKAVEQRQLSQTGFTLLVVLTQFANENQDAKAWPSQTTLRDRIGADSVRSVQRHLDRLEALHLIDVDSGQGKHRVSTYRLIFDKATPMSPFPSDKATPMSPFPDPQKATLVSDKATPVSAKGDTGVRQKATPVSHGTTTSELSRELLFRTTGETRTKTPTSIPSDWPNEEEVKWAKAFLEKKHRTDLIASLDAEFMAVIEEHAKKGTKSRDWGAVWRNRVMRMIKRPHPQRHNGKGH